MVARKSGKAARKPSNCWRTPSAPGAMPGGRLWSTTSTAINSLNAASLPPVWYSSMNRRITSFGRMSVLLRCFGVRPASMRGRSHRIGRPTHVCCSDQQVVLHGIQRRRCSTGYADARVHVLDVVLGSASGDDQSIGNLRVAQSTGDETQDLNLTVSQICRTYMPHAFGLNTSRLDHGASRVHVQPTSPRLAGEHVGRFLGRTRRAMRTFLGRGLKDV